MCSKLHSSYLVMWPMTVQGTLAIWLAFSFLDLVPAQVRAEEKQLGKSFLIFDNFQQHPVPIKVTP